MLRYKKTVEIEAVQSTGTPESAREIIEWGKIDGKTNIVTDYDGRRHGYLVTILFVEGNVAHPNDWIIKGINGEFYPCKPDIFENTYEPVGG